MEILKTRESINYRCLPEDKGAFWGYRTRTHQYLGDFSLDIVSNVIEDSDLDKENPSMDQVLEVTNSLKNAASLIIGPTKSSELEKDILKVIEDIG